MKSEKFIAMDPEGIAQVCTIRLMQNVNDVKKDEDQHESSVSMDKSK